MTNPKADAVNQIARQHLSLETLETRKMDDLDFHEVSVWEIKAALEAAYEAGVKAALKAAAETHGK